MRCNGSQKFIGNADANKACDGDSIIARDQIGGGGRTDDFEAHGSYFNACQWVRNNDIPNGVNFSGR